MVGSQSDSSSGQSHKNCFLQLSVAPHTVHKNHPKMAKRAKRAAE